MDTKGMGLKPQVLIAAVAFSGGDLKKTFTAEDLLIIAWEKNKSAWGLRGYEDQHPDPEKIYKELNRRGKNDLVGMGLLEQVSPLVFRLTPAGLAGASELDPENMEIKAKASRPLQEEIKAILSHPVFRAWLDDPTSPRSFHKAGSFWGIAPGTPPKIARKRVSAVDETLTAAARFLEVHGLEVVSEKGGKNLFDRQDIERCMEFQFAIKERFAKELRRMTGITTKSRALPNRLLLHAVQKWGKTSFAAQAPKPIFICTRGEDGLDTLIKSGELNETAHFEETVKTFRHLLMAIDELLVHPHDYKTLVIDTINGAERLMVEQIIEEHFEGKRESFDAYARGYKFIPDEVHKLLDLLEKLREQKNMSIILLAHSQVKAFQNPEGPNYDRWEPVLMKESWAIIDRWVDMILFGSFETFTEKANKKDTKAKATGGQDRIIHTERHAAFDAGNRYGLPAEIECGDSAKEAWDNFITSLHPNRKKE